MQPGICRKRNLGCMRTNSKVTLFRLNAEDELLGPPGKAAAARIGQCRLLKGIREWPNAVVAYASGFHEKASLCQRKSFARPLGDRARGLALLRGEPPVLRRGGNPPAPAFPKGKRERGNQITLPCCRRLGLSALAVFLTTAESPCFHSHSLLELLAPVPVGVLLFSTGAAISVPN
jgi:hypothetical protein